MLTITAQKRDSKANLDFIRSQGFVPAVFYGPKAPSTPISVKENDFIKVWKEAGESSVITIEGIDGGHDALIHDIDRDPVTGVVRHVDFYVIEKGKKLTVNVPLEYVGVSAAVKDLGGTLVKVLHEIEIEAMPKDLPHNLTVDISSLTDFEQQIKASDIKLPAGVTLITEADEVVVLASPAKEEVEEVAVPVDLSAIELSEKKGKKEEEGAEGAETK